MLEEKCKIFDAAALLTGIDSKYFIMIFSKRRNCFTGYYRG